MIAARRTERFTDHATMPRHARTERPIAPRTAPTAMKTVPSGAVDFCIYGALLVGGTVTTGWLSVEVVDVVSDASLESLLSLLLSDESEPSVLSWATANCAIRATTKMAKSR